MKTLMYILIAILLVSCDDNMYEFQTVEITTIASGSLFGITETSINKQCIIIASDAEWQACKKEMNAVCDVSGYFTTTYIDFSKNEIIAAFGQKEIAGSYNLITLDAVEGESMVYIHVRYHDGVSRTGLNYSQSFVIMTIPKTDKAIQINTVVD